MGGKNAGTLDCSPKSENITEKSSAYWGSFAGMIYCFKWSQLRSGARKDGSPPFQERQFRRVCPQRGEPEQQPSTTTSNGCRCANAPVLVHEAQAAKRVDWEATTARVRRNRKWQHHLEQIWWNFVKTDVGHVVKAKPPTGQLLQCMTVLHTRGSLLLPTPRSSSFELLHGHTPSHNACQDLNVTSSFLAKIMGKNLPNLPAQLLIFFFCVMFNVQKSCRLSYAATD